MRILCLLVILQYLTLYFIQPGAPALQTSFKLAEFTLVFYLFKLMMPSHQGKDIMNMFLVSFLSVVITIYSLKGIMAFPGIMTIVQASILTGLAFIVLFQLINNRQIVLIHEPAFWISGGLLCYFGMVVFMEAIAGNQSDLSQQIQQDKDIIIMFADIMRMVIFAVAAGVAGKKEQPPNYRQ